MTLRARLTAFRRTIPDVGKLLTGVRDVVGRLSDDIFFGAVVDREKDYFPSGRNSWMEIIITL